MNTPYKTANLHIPETTQPSKYQKLIFWINSLQFDPEKFLFSLLWIVGVLFCISVIFLFICLGYGVITGELFAPSSAQRICEAASGIHDPRCVGYFGKDH